MKKETKKKPTRIIKEVKLNNKSRKGNFIYIRENGKKGKYFKRKEDLDNIHYTDYKTFYNDGLRAKKGGITKEKVNKKKRIEQLTKKYPLIEETIEKGYAENTIKNGQNLTHYGIRTAYMNLLRNKDRAGDGHGIVRDKELLELITLPENVEKWKHRIMYEISVYNEKEEKLILITNNTIKNLSEIRDEIIKYIKTGMEVGDFSKRIDEMNLKNRGYSINYNNQVKGRIKEIRIKMVFRKG